MNLRMLQRGRKVRYHPTIGGEHDGNFYTIRDVGNLNGRLVVWLEGKAGCVAVDALSIPQPDNRDDPTYLCPKCGRKTLLEYEGRGEDDCGVFEAYQCQCTACGYYSSDGGRC